jgi:hypothetical protein
MFYITPKGAMMGKFVSHHSRAPKKLLCKAKEFFVKEEEF